jgi:hypothetical protein
LFVAAWFVAAPGVARATPIVESFTVRFEAPEQSVWGGGNSFGIHEVQGSEQTTGIAKGSKIELVLDIDSGSVSGNVEGNLKVRHEDVLPTKGLTPIHFMYEGIPNESKFQTRLGGSIRVDEVLKVDLLWPIPDINISGTLSNVQLELKTDKDFTYATGVTAQDQVERELFNLGADIIIAGVDVDVSVEQKTFFEPEDIMGMIMATHLDSGATRMDGFFGASDAWIQSNLLLDKEGYWFVTLHDLELRDNDFWQKIGGSVSFEAWVTAVWKVLDLKAGLDFYESTPFALDFDAIDALDGGFLMYVVPEPSTGLLVGSGLTVLFGVRRRKLSRPQVGRKISGTRSEKNQAVSAIPGGFDSLRRLD